jgi:hypothetical protein
MIGFDPIGGGGAVRRLACLYSVIPFQNISQNPNRRREPTRLEGLMPTGTNCCNVRPDWATTMLGMPLPNLSVHRNV